MTQDREGRVVRRREVGCQSTSAERRDAAVQVDLLSWRHCAGVCDVQWHCVSVRADEPGGGALGALDSRERCPPLYLLCSPIRHMQLPTMHLSEPSAPPAPQQPELQQTTSLPSMPLCESLPPPNIAAAPPGLIAPLSPRLAVEEEGGGAKAVEQAGRPRRKTVGPPIRYLLESEEQSHPLSAANHSKVGGSKVKRKLEQLRGELKEEQHHEEQHHEEKQHREEEEHHEEEHLKEEHRKEEVDLIKHEDDENFTMTPEKKRRESPGSEGGTQNGFMSGEKPPKVGSKTERGETPRSCRRRRVARVQHTGAEGGNQTMAEKKKKLTEEEGGHRIWSTEEQRKEEEGGGAKPGKKQETEQAGRPRRRAVGPPIRYLLESEEQSHGPSAANHSKAWRPKLKRRLEAQSRQEQEEQEDRRGGGKQTEEMDGSRVEASEDGGVERRRQLCQVCGLTFYCLSSLQLHLSVHRAARRLSCHLCHKKFSGAKTLRLHQLRHHHGNPLGLHSNMTMLEAPKATDDKLDEEESSNGEREERGERSKLEEQKASLQASTKAPDWSRRTKRVCRHSQWWISFRTKMKRRQDAQRRRREERDGERRRNRKMVRAEEEEEEEVKQVCPTEEEGEHGQQEGERQRDGEEVEEEVMEEEEAMEEEEEVVVEEEEEVMEEVVEEEEEEEEEVEEPQRPRRRMVGPPIRYLLESEEPVRAFQQKAKPQKKSEARGGASEDTGQTDRQEGQTLPERQTGSTNQDTGNRPRGEGGRPDKVVLHSEAGGGASEMIDGSDTVERQTGQVMTDRQTDHMHTETGTRHKDPERQTGSYRENYLVYIDVHSRQVTIISPCCVRLQRPPLIG